MFLQEFSAWDLQLGPLTFFNTFSTDFGVEEFRNSTAFLKKSDIFQNNNPFFSSTCAIQGASIKTSILSS